LTCSLVMVSAGDVMPPGYHNADRTWHPKCPNHKFKCL